MLEALHHVGATSRYQYFLSLMNIILSCFTGFICLQFQALTIMQPLECLSDRCTTLKTLNTANPGSLVCTLESDEWKFASDHGHINWLTEYGLYCDNLFLKGMGTTLYFVGFMIGVTPLSSLSDRKGRRSASIWLLLSFVGCIVATKLTTTLFQVFFFRFAVGFVHAGLSVIIFTLSSELTTPKFAAFINIVAGAGFSLGGTVVSSFAERAHNWQDIFAPVIWISTCFLIVFYLTITESPQWLLARNRVPEAIKSLNFIASFNGRPPLPEDTELTTVNKPDLSTNPVSMILGNEILFGWIKKLSFCWFTVSICFYALQFNAGSLGDGEYEVMKYMGLLDIPFRLSILGVANVWGRRKASVIYLSICTSSLVFCLIPWLYTIEIGTLTLKSIMVLVGHGTGAAIFSLMYSYTSEVLPTLARSTGVSMCSAIARIASLLSPFVILLNQVSPSLIFLLAAMCTLMSIHLVRKIPETLNKPLPANIEECETMFRTNGKLEKV